MCFMEGQGVDGHVGDVFFGFLVFTFFQDGLKYVLTQGDFRAVL